MTDHRTGADRDIFIVDKAGTLQNILSLIHRDVSIEEIRGWRIFEDVGDEDFDQIINLTQKRIAAMTKKKFTKVSQMPPPPMPGPPMGGPPMPGAPGAPPPPEESMVPGPLDSINKILLDSEAMDKLKSPQDIQAIAMDIWEQYGGLPNGKVDPRRVGKRSETDENRQAAEVKIENDANEERKWERLPLGKTIIDIVGSFPDFMDDIKKLAPSVVKEMKGGGAPPGGAPPGGMPPMMAASNNLMLKMASASSGLKQAGLMVHADYIEKLILKYAEELQ